MLAERSYPVPIDVMLVWNVRCKEMQEMRGGGGTRKLRPGRVRVIPGRENIVFAGYAFRDACWFVLTETLHYTLSLQPPISIEQWVGKKTGILS